jgi:hypothetical protein
MTSLRQVVSNRRNALKSTGPKTEEGKRRSSRNALRHGLTAETVIEPVEDPDDYTAFEASVTAEYDAETVIERELVLRLASLLWRLRRAGAIETGLMQIQGESAQPASPYAIAVHGTAPHVNSQVRKAKDDNEIANQTVNAPRAIDTKQSIVEIARCFLRLPPDSFALLGRYEASLWRQVRQTIFTLERKRRQATAPSWRLQGPWHRETSS